MLAVGLLLLVVLLLLLVERVSSFPYLCEMVLSLARSVCDLLQEGSNLAEAGRRNFPVVGSPGHPAGAAGRSIHLRSLAGEGRRNRTWLIVMSVWKS